MVDSETEKLLIKSTEQYGKLLRHAENLSEILNNCKYSRINEQGVKLLQLQDDANQVDRQLVPLLKAELNIWKKDRYYQKRINYITSILQLNELLLPKLLGIMAVTSAELKKMRCGHTALAGYTSQFSRKPGIRRIG